MIDQFRTVYRGGTGEIVEKKSRFIATVRLVESEEEALSCLEALRKKYWDARHNCFVYIIGENQETVRCSDDGEPSGTAGRPMLDVVGKAARRGAPVCAHLRLRSGKPQTGKAGRKLRLPHAGAHLPCRHRRVRFSVQSRRRDAARRRKLSQKTRCLHRDRLSPVHRQPWRIT